MSRALITESYLTSIANAIRAKLGVQDTYTPPQMAAAIESIPTGGITPTGTKQITQNGAHDVTQYASANVNVQPNLQSKTATQNGTVVPDQGYDGLSSVVVKVSGGGGGSPSLPPEYQEVEYIGFDGNQYIAVNNMPTAYMIHVLASNSYSTGESYVAGYKGAVNANDDFGIRFQNGSLNGWSRSSSVLTTILSAYPSGSAINVVREIIANLQGLARQQLNIGVLTYEQTDKYPFYGNLYALKIYGPRIAGELSFKQTLMNFIPCYRIADGEIGLYELINGVFYTNDGTGTFTKGADVT